jgi:hypothetical protein
MLDYNKPSKQRRGGCEMKGLKIAKMLCVVVAGLSLIYGGLAVAQSQQNSGLPWDGLIELTTGSVAAGIGFSWGEGKLTQAGKEYPLKVSGLAVGTVGITKASAYGKVYKLANVQDINGTYTAIGAGVTIGGGGTAVTMQNAKGVIIDLISTSEGVKFSVGTAGVTIELKE